MQDQLVLVLLVALVIAVGVAIWLYIRQRQTATLRERFGPEYDRTLQRSGDRHTAEATLQERQERVEHLRIRPLASRERDQFAERWQSAQAQFVDDPKGGKRLSQGWNPNDPAPGKPQPRRADGPATPEKPR